jgi:hypothetical protein
MTRNALLSCGDGHTTVREGDPEATSVVERARRMFVAAPVQQSQVCSDSDQEPQLLNPQVRPLQVLCAVPGVSGLDQRFEHVECGALDTMAKSEFVVGISQRSGAATPGTDSAPRLLR